MSKNLSIKDDIIKRMDGYRPKTELGQLSYSDVIEKAMNALDKTHGESRSETIITKIPGEGVEITEIKK